MILLVRHELTKFYRRFTPYVIYAVILCFKQGGGHHFARAAGRGAPDYEVVGSPLNGVFLCNMVLVSIALLLPYMALVAAGEVLGVEGSVGTLRTLLVRPRSRSAIWFAKFITVLIYTLSLCALMYVTSLGLGTLVFGRGPLWQPTALEQGSMVMLTFGEATRYLALSYAVLGAAVFTTATLAFCLGSFFDSGLAPGFTALAIVITLQIVTNLQFDWVATIKPYCFTSYLSDFTKMMPTEFDPVTNALKFPREALLHTLRACGIYIAVFAAIGLGRFVRRDVTC
ncbi:MAG: ABC transporter permease [Armatimonadetes bacterium]|nr:ABC transporter permease [Armatimonadota bacterium]